MKSTRYSAGDYNVICDRTGTKAKRSQCVKTWDNLIVLKGHEEQRHPQDFIRGGRSQRAVPDARTEAENTYISAGDVTVDDL